MLYISSCAVWCYPRIRLVLTEYESDDQQALCSFSPYCTSTALPIRYISSHCLSCLPSCCCPSSLSSLFPLIYASRRPSSPTHSERRFSSQPVFSTCGPGPGPGPGPRKGSFPVAYRRHRGSLFLVASGIIVAIGQPANTPKTASHARLAPPLFHVTRKVM